MLLEVSLVCSLLVFKKIIILINLELFSLEFLFVSIGLMFSCCSLIFLWQKNEAVVLHLFFEKEIIYCSYYAMCDVLFPVDYPGRSNMSMKFELKEIKYLQRCALQIFFFLKSQK